MGFVTDSDVGHDGLGRNEVGSATGSAAMGSAATELNNQPMRTKGTNNF